MKKAILTFGILSCFLFSGFAQSTLAKGPEITFAKEEHDFGNMKQHGDASTEFKFTNTGTEPLIISNARGSCGCTVPEWPNQPIKPGETAAIKVKYDSKRVGPINKSVTISSNAINEAEKVIRIKGNIEAVPEPEGGGMPVNEKPVGAPVEK